MSDMDQHIDKIFKDRLQQHDSGAPMHLWSGIIAERKPKRGFFFWLNGKSLLIGLAVFTTIALSGYFILSGESSETDSVTEASTISNGSFERGGPPVVEKETSVGMVELQAEEPLPMPAGDNDTATDVVSPAAEEAVLTEKGVSDTWMAELSTLQVEGTNEQVIGTGLEEPVLEGVIMAADAKEEFTSAVDFLPLAGMEVTAESEAELQPGKCVSFADPNWSTYLDLYFSPDYAIRSLSARNPLYTEYAKLRSEESFQFAFTAGVRYNVVAPKGFGIRIGLQYTQIGELFSHTDPDAIEEYILNEYDPVDGTLISSDTTYVYGTAIKEIHNYYRTIDVPVMVGYEWEFDRVKVSAYGGMIANLWFGKKGQFFAPDQEQIVEFTDNSATPYPAFKDHLSAHVAGAFSLQYQFSPNAFLLLEPHFRVFPRGITREDYVLNQKYFVSGVAFGLRYKL